MQSMYFRDPGMTLEELKKRVKKVYNKYPKEKINDAYITLQDTMNQIIEANGMNDYKLGHRGQKFKSNKFYNNTLRVSPISISVTPVATIWENNYTKKETNK